jgi:flagellar biosynthesis protein FlhF
VDTAGRSHKNEEQIKELSEYLAAVKKVKTVDMDTILVLSATTKYKDLIQIVSSYDFADDFRLLFTKLDETSAYGNILNIKLQTGAGLTYFTMGQNVPDDIEKVNVQWLARQIIGGNE